MDDKELLDLLSEETEQETPTEEIPQPVEKKPKKKKRRAGKIIALLLCLVVLPAALLAAVYFGFVRP